MDENTRQALANLAAAEKADREALARRIEELDAPIRAKVAERQAAERAREQEEEQARQQREQAAIDAEQEAARRSARAVWVGSDAEFEAAWPGIWKQHQVDQARKAVESQEIAARHHYAKTF